MFYLIDPKTIRLDSRCKKYCIAYCPLDMVYPLYGIPW